MLGCGYDATGRYANAKSVSLPIFDLGSFDATIVAPNGITYSLPSRIKDKIALREIEHGQYSCVEGESAEEFRSRLSAKIKISGSSGFFSGSVTSSFTQEQRASLNHKFVKVRHLFEGWVLTLPDYSSLQMIDPAQGEINETLPAQEVIRRYGTHVLLSAVIGGRADYVCFVDLSKYQSELEIATVATASYTSVLSLDAEMEAAYEKEIKQFKRSSTTRFSTIGGDFDPDFDPKSFRAWMRTFKERPVLIDFTDRSLVEIYKLASDEERRNELKRAYNEYLQEAEKRAQPNIPLLEVEIVSKQSVDFVASDAGSGATKGLKVYKPKLPPGWNWLGHSGNCEDRLIRIRSLVPGAVSKPLDYSCAWKDSGSGQPHGYSLWNISPPPHYRALGGIARLRKEKTNWKSPSGEEVEGLVCLHKSLCVEGMIGNSIWSDKGTGAKANGSVWGIKPNGEDEVPANTFYCQDSHYKPNAKVYAIERRKVKVEENL